MRYIGLLGVTLALIAQACFPQESGVDERPIGNLASGALASATPPQEVGGFAQCLQEHFTKCDGECGALGDPLFASYGLEVGRHLFCSPQDPPATGFRCDTLARWTVAGADYYALMMDARPHFSRRVEIVLNPEIALKPDFVPWRPEKGEGVVPGIYVVPGEPDFSGPSEGPLGGPIGDPIVEPPGFPWIPGSFPVPSVSDPVGQPHPRFRGVGGFDRQGTISRSAAIDFAEASYTSASSAPEPAELEPDSDLSSSRTVTRQADESQPAWLDLILDEGWKPGQAKRDVEIAVIDTGVNPDLAVELLGCMDAANCRVRGRNTQRFFEPQYGFDHLYEASNSSDPDHGSVMVEIIERSLRHAVKPSSVGRFRYLVYRGLAHDGCSPVDGIVTAISEAIEEEVDVILTSLQLRAQQSPKLRAAFDRARNEEILVVTAAATLDDSNGFPAPASYRLKNQLVVGHLNVATKSPVTPAAAPVDLWAPGDGFDVGPRLHQWADELGDGSSQAAAVTAAAAAVLFSLAPSECTVLDVREALLRTVDSRLGVKILQLDRALRLLQLGCVSGATGGE